MCFSARVYITVIISLGTLGFAGALLHWDQARTLQFLLYLLAALVASPMKVRLPGIESTMSVNYLFILLAVTELSLPHTLSVAALGTLAQCLWGVRRPRPVQISFNVAAAVLAGATAYRVFHSEGIRAVDDSLPTVLFLSSVSYFLINTSTVSAIICLTAGKSFLRTWHDSFLWTTPQYLVGAALAGLIHRCNQSFGWQWSLLLFPLLYLTYNSYRLYLGRLSQEQRHVGEMADLHLRTIEALAVAIDAKDEVTHEHLHRVQTNALRIGKRMKLSEEQLRALEAAALLHDIGKLGVPEYILNKPGRLTPEEFERIKLHPMIGADILERVRFPYPVVPIVAAHHEKWDGTGYPAGLKGEDIPIGARILTVIDCLDALTSHRQYRRALPFEEAMQMVVDQAGKSYDPRVVELVRAHCGDFAHQKAAGRSFARPAAAGGAAPAAGFESAAASSHPQDCLNAIAQARQEFQILHEVATEMGNSLRVEEMLALLASRMEQLIRHDAIAIFAIDKNHLKPCFVRGQSANRLSALVIPAGEGLSGWVAEHRKPIVNGNPAVELGYLEDASDTGALRSALSVPLMGISGVTGILTLYHAAPDAFTRDHVRILQAVASKVGRMLENAFTLEQARLTASTDDLTGLPNSRTLFMHLDAEMSRCRRSGSGLAVLVLDLDGFKQVNDELGHLRGNQVLKAVAEELNNSSRDHDLVARMGGDEFVIVMPDISLAEVTHKMSRMRLQVEAIGARFGAPFLSLSAGEAGYPVHGATAEDLLAEADRRMYEVKKVHRQNKAALKQASPAPRQTSMAAK